MLSSVSHVLMPVSTWDCLTYLFPSQFELDGRTCVVLFPTGLFIFTFVVLAKKLEKGISLLIVCLSSYSELFPLFHDPAIYGWQPASWFMVAYWGGKHECTKI